MDRSHLEDDDREDVPKKRSSTFRSEKDGRADSNDVGKSAFDGDSERDRRGDGENERVHALEWSTT